MTFYPYLHDLDFFIEVSRGKADPRFSLLQKFGRNVDVGATFEDIWLQGGLYVWATTAAQLDVVCANVNDTAAGSGAQEITITGLDASWNMLTEAVATNGATATSTGSFIRVFRAYVSKAGAYATGTTIGGQAGDITIRRTGAGDIQILLEGAAGEKQGQSQVARYTVPANHQLIISSIGIETDSAKVSQVELRQRPDADNTGANYTAWRLVYGYSTISGEHHWDLRNAPKIFPAMTDLSMVASVTGGGGAVSAHFEGILEDLS